MSDLWLVGDDSLRTWFPILQEIRSESVKRNSKPPFMYDCYNVFPFYTGSSGPLKDTLTRILSSLTEGFNRREKLPRYIMFIIDKDLLESLTPLEDFGVTEGITALFNWVAKLCERLVCTRKDNLLDHRMGAVCYDTKICWLKMIQRPFISYSPAVNKERFDRSTSKYFERVSQVLGSRRKNNAAIDELALKMNHYVVEIKDFNAYQDFDKFGKLTKLGKSHYWKQLDKQLKDYEKKIITWKPSTTQLPPPPPSDRKPKSAKGHNKYY